jgi:hypothetical protein
MADGRAPIFRDKEDYERHTIKIMRMAIAKHERAKAKAEKEKGPAPSKEDIVNEVLNTMKTNAAKAEEEAKKRGTEDTRPLWKKLLALE